ncbi:SgcJ/EcaC family oxidoreductase [Prauserella muralis]|uniref:DUF4440 domain-containing protein n=1 Tax=Prauserella muralis TaxID=588067 RepID=A0A2V4AM10_9PSEU|nr:SgcJ/EcaC family oxidoreductase [Prauserella muralis]PXY21024.1 DUF4440 domain-containing protein [Prauserella muralis]TWE30096.1 uncharacterized protein (TIGR02246 family) [Prauserella muralis]
MTSVSPQPPTAADATAGTETDIAAIRQIVADTETAFNTNDPDLLSAHFARDANVVNAAGVRLSGRSEIDEANRQGLAGFLRDQYARYDVADIVFLRPDVALAYKEARATTADGELIDLDHTMIALYVLVRQQGRWWIAARQNTLVAS